MRLGLFVDAAFRAGPAEEGSAVFCGDELLGFGRFACAVGESFESFVLIARGTQDAEATPHRLPAGVQLIPLPHYASLRQLREVLGVIPATVAALWRALDAVDVVWVSASNPIGLIIFALARLRGRRTAILVRQDSMEYFRRRLPSRLWTPVLAPLWAVDRIYRILGTWKATTAVGAQIAKQYGAPRANVLQFTVNLMSRSQIPEVPGADPPREGPVRLLTVGRVEPEKNPLLLAEVLALLEKRRPGRFRATWAGEGRMRDDLRARAEELGVAGQLDLPGFVPFGEALFKLYRGADVFVHIALTEGVPGVLAEAMANAVPIVATDVGGIGAEVGHGASALLVKADDPPALADAVLRVLDEPDVRREIVSAGLEHARATSLESQSGRVAAFLAEA